MTDATSRHQLESIKETARINSSIEKLRIKLKHFIVINRQGQLIGEVKDLILEPNHQINFVVSQNYSDRSPRLFLLISKLVQKVDPSNQSVIVDINKAEIEHFPEYLIKETPGMETSDTSDSSRMSADKAVNEDTSEDRAVYPTATPAADADIFTLDLDDISTSDVASAGVEEQDMILLESDVYPTAMPAADTDIFTLDLDDISTSDVASPGVQEQDMMLESDVYPMATPTAGADIFSLDDLDDRSRSDVASAGVEEQDMMLESDVYPTADADIFSLDLEDTSTSEVAASSVQEQDMMPDSSDVYSTVTPATDADIFSLDLEDTSTSDIASASVQEQPDERTIKPTDTPEVLEEEIIRLLGERLIIDRGKRKVGEVIVRKEIEIRMVQVPVRREKLIVEQVSPERKQLAEIDLGIEEISTIELTDAEITGTKLPETTNLGNEFTVKGEFNSPKIASLLLNAIALERRQGCKKVRIEIVVEDAERQKTYQEWADRCSSGKPPDSNL